MKWIYFLPYGIYRFLIKKGHSENRAFSIAVAWSGLCINAIFVVSTRIRNLIQQTASIICENHKIGRSIILFISILLWYLVIKKNKLDSLIFSQTEKKIIKIIGLLIAISPIIYIILIILYYTWIKKP